jgi:tetratricopeptide (TPR) repeat protein
VNRKQRRAQELGNAASTATRPSSSVEALFAEAVSAHRAGALAEAERRYRQILATDPGHAGNLHLLGVVAAQSGRFAEAEALIGAALSVNPANADALGDLGNVLRSLGRGEDAVRSYRAALVLRPDNPQAAFNFGLMLASLDRTDEAADAFRRTLELSPGHYLAHNSLAVALRTLGRPAEAETVLRRAIALQPGQADAHLNLGIVLHDLGRPDAAFAAFEAARQLSPGRAEPSNNLALALRELGRTEALAATDAALAADPGSATAWYIRSDLKRFESGDPDIAAMEGLLASASQRNLPADAVVQLEFALGKAWRDAGDVDRAFGHYAAGNRRKRATFTYDAAADAARIAAYAAATPAEVLARLAGAGVPDERPVFVVGMPRSGTTLVEQILASHSEIASVGETPALGEVVRAAVRADHALISAADYERLLSPEPLRAVANDYLHRLPQGPARRVVDKTPANFQFAGVIAPALPGARIIHCRRDAADTCLSCYTTLFTGRQDFAYDLAELGGYYRAYAAAMAHWREVLPADRLLEIDYEALVDDLEGQARRMIAFSGLEWEPACLDFHRPGRRVQTASASQVRRPAYRSSIRAAAPFEAHLAPLLAALRG